MLLSFSLFLQALVPLGPPPVPAGNPVSAEKAVLGKILFWDEQLSSDDTIACGTCHRPEAGGAEVRNAEGIHFHPGVDTGSETSDDSFGSLGVALSDVDGTILPDPDFEFEPQVTRRVAPTVIGAAYFGDLFWDGRATGAFLDPQTGQVSLPQGAALENQVAETLLSSVEMSFRDRTWAQVITKLQGIRPLALASDFPPDVSAALPQGMDYAGLFDSAFGSPVITADRICRAIATYMRTLVPDRTPFDRFAAGDSNALNLEQQQGLLVLETIGRCTNCHVPPLFASETFRNIGLRPADEDLGRFAVTGDAEDRGSFKVPTLRNVALRDRFFHHGAVTSLNEVLAFYARGGDFGENRDEELGFISLPPATQEFAVTFLKTALVDERVLRQEFPFDRPTLYSELELPGPRFLQAGVRGALGKPRILATSPPAVEGQSYRVSLAGAAPFSFAVLTRSISGGQPAVQSTGPFGTASLVFALQDLSMVSGQSLELQWWVRDVTAPGGVSRSDRIEVTVF